MKKADLSQLAIADLQEKLKEEKNTVERMKFNHSISPVENPMRIRILKKSIARMMTELRKRELAETKK